MPRLPPEPQPPRDVADAQLAALRSLVLVVDRLEASASGYVTLDDVQAALGPLAAALDRALAEDLLLVDERLQLEGTGSCARRVTLCRLNRHHPLVRAVVSFD